MKKSEKPHIVLITSHPMSVVNFFLPHLHALSKLGYLHVFANTTETNLLFDRGLSVPIINVPLERSIRLFQDILALWILYRKLLKQRPHIVHTLTPKAGLLGMSAAWLAGVPVRIHSFTGQVWVTRRGVMRWILKVADKCTAAMATDLLVDSPSQRDFLINEGILLRQNSAVLGAGSICGVNTRRFYPNKTVRLEVRMELSTSDKSFVCLYLGRLNRDKGLIDLAKAFAKVAQSHPNTELWIVGPDEDGTFVKMQSFLKVVNRQVKRVGFTSVPERYMQAADLFCLPSYREGFGSSVIESAACGVPSLTSRIYGLTDAVVEGQTGWMHEAGNVLELSQKLHAIFNDPVEISTKGKAARQYSQINFSEELITKAMVLFYTERLHETYF